MADKEFKGVKVKDNIYSLTRTAVGDVLILTKNDVPLMTIPEHLYEDFVQLLVHAGAADRFLTENPKM